MTENNAAPGSPAQQGEAGTTAALLDALDQLKDQVVALGRADRWRDMRDATERVVTSYNGLRRRIRFLEAKREMMEEYQFLPESIKEDLQEHFEQREERDRDRYRPDYDDVVEERWDYYRTDRDNIDRAFEAAIKRAHDDPARVAEVEKQQSVWTATMQNLDERDERERARLRRETTSITTPTVVG